MKKILLMAILPFIPLLLTAQIPTANLLAYYPFSGNANDYGPNGLNGTVNGATLTADRFGNPNCAYSFNGSSNYISAPTTSIIGLNVYSYSFWFKPLAFSSSDKMVWCSGESGPYCQGFGFQSAGTLFAGSYNNGSNPVQSYSQSGAFGLNNWIHVVVTRDFTAIKLYVNGVLTGYTSTSNTNNQSANYGTTTPYRVFFGARTNNTAYFNGLIDDIRIYSAALVQSDVTSLYNENCFQTYPVTSYSACVGSQVSLTAVPASSTSTTGWYSSPTSTVALATGSLYSPGTYSAAGIYTYYVSASGCTLSATNLPITVTVNPQPTVSVNSGGICSGNSFTISPSGASTYTISGSTSVVSPTITTSYSVTGTSAYGCTSGNTAICNITVSPTPTISVNSGFICSGDSFTFTPSGASSYTYSSGSAIVSPSVNTSYVITGSSGAGCYSSATASVAVSPTPTVTISSPGSICINGSATLSATGANVYTWNSGIQASSIVVSPTATTSYSVVGANYLGCIGTASVTLIVNPLPTITVNSGSVCAGKAFTMVPSGAANYTYSGGSNVVSPLTNTSYSVTGSSAAGCISSNTAVANVSVVASPTITVNNGVICSGGSFVIAPSGGISYTYSGGSATVSPTSNTNYTVTGNNSSGCSASAVSSVTVNSLPVITITSPGSICSGNNATLSASGATSYTWSTGATTTSIVVSPAGNSSYSVTGINGNGCLNTASAGITVNPLPVISVNSGSVCQGSAFGITPSGASTYTISGGSFVVTPVTTTSYSVTGTSAAGCVSSNTAVSTVSVSPVPTLSVNSGSICAGGSFTLVTSGALSYTYSGGSSVVTPATTTSYTVSGSNASGCTASSVATVTVVALPVISISSPGSVCAGSAATLTASGAVTYSWNNGSNSAAIAVLPSLTTTYAVTGNNTSGCQSTVTTTLIVNPLPVISVNSGSVCSGGIFTLVPSGAASYTYSGGSNLVSPLSNTSYSVTGTSAAGCISASPAISTVTVVALPVVTANSGSICAGNIFTIVPSGALSYSYSSGTATVSPTSNTSYTVTGMSANGCTVSAIASVSVTLLPVITVNSGSVCAGSTFIMTPSGAFTYTFSNGSSTVIPSSSTSYSVTGTSAAGCIAAAAIANVTVNPIPVITVNSGTVCSGKIFTMTPGGAATYVYSNGSNTVIPTGNTSYSVTGTSAQGCVSASPAIASVTVVASPTITAASSSICAGSSYTIVPAGASTYTFSGGSAIVSPATTTSYSITGTGTTGCPSSNTAVATVTVNALPLLTISGNVSICQGNSTTLTASGASSYTWNPASTNVSISVSPASNLTVNLTGLALNGCSASIVKTITVNPLPTISINSGSICSGSSFVLTPSGAGTYTFSSGSATVSPLTNTNYSVTGTSSAGCVASNTAVASVSVIALPLVSILGPSVTCAGSAIVLTGSGAQTYSWSNTSTNSSVSLAPLTNTVYALIGTSAQGCSATAIASITVYNLPTITVNSGAICPGNSFTLSPSGATTYTYSSGSNQVNPATTTSYSITGTDNNGCQSAVPAIATVSVVNTLTISINGPTVACLGQTVTFTANGASTYSWNSGAQTPTLSVIPSGPGAYTVTGVSGACSNTAAINLAVNPLPTVTVNSGTICASTAFVLQPSGALSYSYSGGSNTVTPATTTTYSVTGTDGNGCSNTAQSIITVHALPVIVATSAASPLCAGEAATLTVSGANTYTWYSGENTATITFTPLITSIYTVTGIDLNGCSNTASVAQIVDPCLGITNQQFNNAQLAVYPNPNTGSFIIKYGTTARSFIITDIQGKIISEVHLDPTNSEREIKNWDVSKGLYFWQLTNGSQIISSGKMIVN